MAINRNDASPLHVQVADDIRRRIATGEFAPGDKLPSLRSLTSAYEVAEATVHTAIRELQRTGLLVSTTGRGTFVTDNVEAIERAGSGGEVDALRSEVADLRRRVESLESHVVQSKSQTPDAP